MASLEEIRKQLQGHSASAAEMPLRILTAKERTRKKRLERQLQRIDSGKDVARRDLETALTADEWTTYEAMDEQETALKTLDERPAEFARYIEMLKLADFYHTRALVTKTTKRSRRDSQGRTGVGRLFDKGESWYEDALIHLEEIVLGADAAKRAELLSWLDRDVEFVAGSALGADCVNIPRVRGSKSKHAQAPTATHNIFEMRRLNKRRVLQQALDSLIFQDAVTEEGIAETAKAAARRAALLKIASGED